MVHLMSHDPMELLFKHKSENYFRYPILYKYWQFDESIGIWQFIHFKYLYQCMKAELNNHVL